MIQQSFYANLGLYHNLEAGILDKITDTPAITEITVGNLEMPISENISLNESNLGGGAIGGLNDYLIIYEEIDGRVRGALKTIFISDERYFNNVGTTGPRTRRDVFPWWPNSDVLFGTTPASLPYESGTAYDTGTSYSGF